MPVTASELGGTVLPGENGAVTLTEEVIGQAGEAGSIEIIEIARLHTDRTYQRELSNDLVDQIARDFSYATCGTIVVSKRPNGDLYIVDGQHRTAAAMRANKTHILAQVIEGMEMEREARERLQGNVSRTDTIFERFRARLAAGDPEALAIRELVERFGSHINESPRFDEGINAIGTVEHIYRLDRGVTLTRVLELIQDVWGTPQAEYATATILKGCTWLVTKHGDGLNRGRLVERMQGEGIAALMRLAASHAANLGGAMWMNFYRACIEAYNKNLPLGSRVDWLTGGWSKLSPDGTAPFGGGTSGRMHHGARLRHEGEIRRLDNQEAADKAEREAADGR